MNEQAGTKPSAIGFERSKARKKVPAKKNVPPYLDLEQARAIVRETFRGAILQGQDLDQVQTSLKKRFSDPTLAKMVDEEAQRAKSELGLHESGKEGVGGQNRLEEQSPPAEEVPEGEEGPQSKPEDNAPEAQSIAPGAQPPNAPSDGRGTVVREEGHAKGNGEEGIKSAKNFSSQPFMQDIPLAPLPGGSALLPGLAESLSTDLRKYAHEKAWHDAWRSAGSRSTGGTVPLSEPTVSLGDRVALVGQALGKGAVAGVIRGGGELVVQQLITLASKRIPYLSGFVELGQVILNAKGWVEANYVATVKKWQQGWDRLFGHNSDFFTRVEGLINLLDGVSNAIGILGSICQVVAAVLFAGGLVLSLFGVGAALVAAAPIIGKVGFIASEISAVIKLGINGLRPLIIAGRALQILTEKSADPSKLAATAESLERATEDWASEFTKAKGKKLSNKIVKQFSKDKAGLDNSKKSASNDKGEVSKPDKPKKFADRLKAFGSKTLDVLAVVGGGEKGEFQKKARKVDQHLKKDGDLAQKSKQLGDEQKKYKELKNRKRVLTENLERLNEKGAPRRERRGVQLDICRLNKKIDQTQRTIESLVKYIWNSNKFSDSVREEREKVILGQYGKSWWKHEVKEWTGSGDESTWKSEKERELGEERERRKKEKVEELSRQYVSIAATLPEPPLDAEAQVDANAKRHNALVNEIQEIEFQKKVLEDMRKDAEIEKTGLDVLNKLALANRARIEELKQQAMGQVAVTQDEKAKVREMSDASVEVQQAGQKGKTHISFLSRLASLLGMVPSKIAGDAGAGIQAANQTSEGLEELGKMSVRAETKVRNAQQVVQEHETKVDQAQSHIAKAHATGTSVLEQQLALEAELHEGEAYIKRGLELAEARKRAKEAEKEKAAQDYLAAKKRLLTWAILHEQIRKGQEATFEEAMRMAEQEFVEDR